MIKFLIDPVVYILGTLVPRSIKIPYAYNLVTGRSGDQEIGLK